MKFTDRTEITVSSVQYLPKLIGTLELADNTIILLGRSQLICLIDKNLFILNIFTNMFSRIFLTYPSFDIDQIFHNLSYILLLIFSHILYFQIILFCNKSFIFVDFNIFFIISRYHCYIIYRVKSLSLN